MTLIYAYGAALLTLLALDAVWLSLSKGFYMSHVGHLFAPSITWWAAVLFYVLYAIAIVYFAAQGATSLTHALMRGAFFGFTAYMTYDLVNLATLSGWTISLSLVDIGWGTVITALATAAAFLVL